MAATRGTSSRAMERPRRDICRLPAARSFGRARLRNVRSRTSTTAVSGHQTLNLLWANVLLMLGQKNLQQIVQKPPSQRGRRYAPMITHDESFLFRAVELF